MDDGARKRPNFVPATFRRIGKEHTDEGLVLTVFCAKQTAVLPISECRACSHCTGLSIDTSDGDSFLRCNFAAPSVHPFTAPLDDEHQEASVGDLMTTPVRCVTKDMSAEKLLRILLEDGISAAPVINAEGRPIGIVSKTDLLREQLRGGLPDDLTMWGGPPGPELPSTLAPLKNLTVGELMTPFAFTLSTDSPVSLACALMSYEAVHRIAVTEQDGSVVGILSSLDVMRWLAVERGYTVPSRRRKQPV